ncbi:MAG TPA: hypothetical protein VFX59_17120 [Polyangiales bacterium]|nr:hypothetical protein [Polyangiales bacterium]
MTIGDVVAGLMLIGPRDPADSDFFGMMDSLSQTMSHVGARLERVRLMTITDGGAPTVRQRAKISAWLAGRRMKVCVVSSAYDNPIKRGITTAVQWINPDLGFFRPTEIRQALAHVDLTSALGRIWSEYRSLETRLGPLPVMKAIGTTIGAEA